MEQTQTQGKVVYFADVARKLIKYYGFNVVDIKPNRRIPNASIFVFDRNQVVNENKMEDILLKLINEKKAKDNSETK